MAANNSNPAGQLDCMDAEYMEPEHDIGPCDYRPGLSGATRSMIHSLSHTCLTLHGTGWSTLADAGLSPRLSSKTPPAPFDSRERRQGPDRPRLPRLPEGDHKARIRVRKEQNITLVSTPDPDLADKLCHIQTLLLGSKSYQVSAYVAPPNNSCNGVITGALPIPTEDALMNETVTYPHAINIIQARPFGKNGACLYTFEGRRVPSYVYFEGVDFDADLSAQSPKCSTAASEPDIDTTSAHTHKNGDEHHERCLPRCLTCGSDDHPSIDLGCPARQRGFGPRVVKEGCQDPKGHNTTPPRRDTKVSTTNQQPPTIRTSATPLSNYPPLALAQCGARSEVTWPALPQREPTEAPGSVARGGPTGSSSSATGGSLDPDPQLQQRQDPWPTLVSRPLSRPPQYLPTQHRLMHQPNPYGGPSEGGTEYTALEMIPSNPTSGKGLPNASPLTPPAPDENLDADARLPEVKQALARAVKTALRLPVRTSTTHLLQTGLHNTVQEIIEAQRSNQPLRLSRTPTGRILLRTVGFEPSGTIPNEEPWCPILVRLAAHMHLKPLPRNINVQSYPGRRKARADYYARRYQNREDVLYVDAAVGPLEGTATVAAMMEDGRINISASVKTARTDVADGVALALAVAHAATDSTITEICTDTQSSYRYFLQGIPPKTVTHILQNIPPLPHPVTITWVPGHEFVIAQVRGHSLWTLDDHSPKPT
ncbi:hypothetical protein HPB49_006581 [Dermacentor silvarum]|uniref:Uncharacterized protein n=1 Tax=Dermacentor silvarum TaxID=543639 RepID=A0ACB8DBJ7_DERSI|nr:hypothetical protein HPB49_006581 [Dermacentor silvarum]